MISAILFLIAGFLLGHLMPRVPFMILSRTSGFNTKFPPHPDPIPLSPRLTQRASPYALVSQAWNVYNSLAFVLRLSQYSWRSIHIRLRIVPCRRLDTPLSCTGSSWRSTGCLHFRDGSKIADCHEYRRLRRCLLSTSTAAMVG